MGLGGSTMVWQHSLWNVDKGITGWDSASGAHFSPCQRKTACWTHKDKVLRLFGESIKVTRRDDNRQLGQTFVRRSLRRAGIQTLERTWKKGNTNQDRKFWKNSRAEESLVRCEAQTNCPREGWKWEQVRGSKGGRGEEEKRNSSLTLLSVRHTGLLGSCYGYGDSRLSVLLTIAHKGSIQLSLSLSLSLFLCLSLHLSLCT